MSMQEPGRGTEQEPSGARAQISQAVDEVTSRAAPVVDQAQDKASQVLDQARQQATTRLGGQKDRAVDSLEAVVQAAHQTSQQLRQQGQDTVANYTDQAAAQVERLVGYLREHEVDELVDQAEHFARQQPQLFLVGGVTLGLLAARFFKSSARHPNQQLNTGTALARTDAYGGNFSAGTGQGGLGGRSSTAATHRPPSYADTAPDTSMGTGGRPMRTSPIPPSTSLPSTPRPTTPDTGTAMGRGIEP